MPVLPRRCVVKELARRCCIAVLAYATLYIGLRIIMGGDWFDLPYDLGLLWVVWVVWTAFFAAGDALSVLADWRTRRARRRAPARPVSLADYMPGGTSQSERVNRAA